MNYLTVAQVHRGLKDRDSLIRFVESELGYTTNLVFFEAADLGIPPSLARQISSWWLLSHYPGKLPFQIHLVEINQLPSFRDCCKIADSFLHRHPGYFLFIFTQDYSYILFFTVELNLEGKFISLPKPYYCFLLLERARPTDSHLKVLTELRADFSQADPATLHEMVVKALKSERPDLPNGFMSFYDRVGYYLRYPLGSQDTYNKLRQIRQSRRQSRRYRRHHGNP